MGQGQAALGIVAGLDARQADFDVHELLSASSCTRSSGLPRGR